MQDILILDAESEGIEQWEIDEYDRKQWMLQEEAKFLDQNCE